MREEQKTAEIIPIKSHTHQGAHVKETQPVLLAIFQTRTPQLWVFGMGFFGSDGIKFDSALPRIT